jgi:hypothetical protein
MPTWIKPAPWEDRDENQRRRTGYRRQMEMLPFHVCQTSYAQGTRGAVERPTYGALAITHWGDRRSLHGWVGKHVSCRRICPTSSARSQRRLRPASAPRDLSATFDQRAFRRAACSGGCGPLLWRRKIHARPASLEESDGNGLLRRARTVFVFANVLDLFTHEFACLRRGSPARALRLARPLECRFTWLGARLRRFQAGH